MFVYFFAHGLNRLGHQVTVAGIWDRDTEADDEGIRVVTRASSMGRAYIDDRRRFRDWLNTDVAANNTDIVEVPDFNGMMPFPFMKCPVVVRLQQTWSGIRLNQLKVPHPLGYLCERRTLKFHPYWIASSRFVLNYNRRIFFLKARKSQVIYNFAPPEDVVDSNLTETFRQRYDNYALFIGKVSPGKGCLDLARAANVFLHEMPDLKLVYVGRDILVRGVRTSCLVRAIISPDIQNRVVFTGEIPRDELLSCIAAARAVVLPSHIEAFSLTPLEAFRRGVPVIYTNRASGPEVIQHGVNGILVNPSEPLEIARAVSLVLTNRTVAESLVTAARRCLLEHFTLERCLAKTLDFYTELLTARYHSERGEPGFQGGKTCCAGHESVPMVK